MMIETNPRERKETILAERKRKMRLAYQVTSEKWKEATYQFSVRIFLPQTREFIFETLRVAYNETARITGALPPTVENRAFAGLQQRLVREKLIEPVKDKFGMRSQGNASQIYRSNLFGR